MFIGASSGEYGNTNFVLDDVRHGATYVGDNRSGPPVLGSTTNALIALGVSASAILYAYGLDEITNGIQYNGPHITNAVNVAGYVCWGAHSGLNNDYAIDSVLQWQANSSWWIIETIESFNGRPGGGMGDFHMWFDHRAFGGMNYSSTPVGAVSHVDEPFLGGVNDFSSYFGLWATGKAFGICAWNSRRTPYFQAIGDPFVRR